MSDKKLLLIGGGGHCKSVIDALMTTSEYSEIGIIDKKDLLGSKILGKKIIGCDHDLEKFYQTGYKYAFISIGSIGNTQLRRKLYDYIKQIGFNVPNIIDSSATVSKNALLSEGVFVGKGAIINAGSIIKSCTIINTGAIIEHDCTIEAFTHIGPGATLGGHVYVGNDAHIGINSTVKQSISIGAHAMIGMGSNVLRTVPSHVMAFGNPCRVVSNNDN